MSAVAHIDEYKKGTFYTEEFRGAMSWNGYENNNLFRGDGVAEDGIPRFTDVGMVLGADDNRDARGLAVFDYDHDGDLDIAVNHGPGDNDDFERQKVVLYRNEIGASRSWLLVELQGTRSNPEGLGAVVTVVADGQQQSRLRSAGSSFASQHSSWLHFGLGENESVELLTVHWPSGLIEEFANVEARQRIRLVEGEGKPTKS